MQRSGVQDNETLETLVRPLLFDLISGPNETALVRHHAEVNNTSPIVVVLVERHCLRQS